METKIILMMESLFNSLKLYFILVDNPFLPGELSIENHYRRLNYSREFNSYYDILNSYHHHVGAGCLAPVLWLRVEPECEWGERGRADQASLDQPNTLPEPELKLKQHYKVKSSENIVQILYSLLILCTRW